MIVGETVTAPFSVENVAGDTFRLEGAPTIVGADASDFQVVAAPPTTVAELQSVAGTLSFSPQAPGARTGQVSFPTNIRGTPLLAGALSGTGVDPNTVTLTVYPTSCDFGQVEINNTAMRPLQITNTGNDPAPLQPLQITGPNAADFGVVIPGRSGTTPAPLAAGSSLLLSVTFNSATLGTQTAALQVQACKLCAPLSVPLTGIGFTPGLVFVPPTLTFTGIGRQQSQTQSWTLTNEGNATATVVGLTFIDGGAPFSFDFGSKPSVELPKGQSFTFKVAYAPPLSETLGEMDQAVLLPLTTGVTIPPAPGVLSATVAINCQLSVPASLFFGFAEPPYYDPSPDAHHQQRRRGRCPVSQFAFAPGSDLVFDVRLAPAREPHDSRRRQRRPVADLRADGVTDASLHQATLDDEQPANRASPHPQRSPLGRDPGQPLPAEQPLAEAHAVTTTATPACRRSIPAKPGRSLQWRTSTSPGERPIGSGPAIDADGNDLPCSETTAALYALSRGGHASSGRAIAERPGDEVSPSTCPFRPSAADDEVVVLTDSIGSALRELYRKSSPSTSASSGRGWRRPVGRGDGVEHPFQQPLRSRPGAVATFLVGDEVSSTRRNRNPDRLLRTHRCLSSFVRCAPATASSRRTAPATGGAPRSMTSPPMATSVIRPGSSPTGAPVTSARPP